MDSSFTTDNPFTLCNDADQPSGNPGGTCRVTSPSIASATGASTAGWKVVGVACSEIEGAIAAGVVNAEQAAVNKNKSETIARKVLPGNFN